MGTSTEIKTRDHRKNPFIKTRLTNEGIYVFDLFSIDP